MKQETIFVIDLFCLKNNLTRFLINCTQAKIDFLIEGKKISKNKLYNYIKTQFQQKQDAILTGIHNNNQIKIIISPTGEIQFFPEFPYVMLKNYPKKINIAYYATLLLDMTQDFMFYDFDTKP